MFCSEQITVSLRNALILDSSRRTRVTHLLTRGPVRVITLYTHTQYYCDPVLLQKESWSISVLLGRIKLQIPISETSHEAKLHSELQKGTFTIKSPRIFNIFIKHRRPTYKENSVYLTKLALNQKSTFSHSTIMQYMYCILIWPCSPERDL